MNDEKHKYTQAIKTLFDSIVIMFDEYMTKVPCDVTYDARVMSKNNDSTYTIILNGISYQNIYSYTNVTINVNDIVKVTYPQNQASSMYISGKRAI